MRSFTSPSDPFSCDCCGGSLRPMAGLSAHGCHECARCRLVVCLPLPSPESISSQYDDSEYFARRGDDAAIHFQAKFEANLPLARQLRADLGSGARLLEVGSATGAFVAAARRERLNATGIEPSSYAVAAATRLGVQLIHGTLDTVSMPANAFDAALALHVLEHVVSPSAFIRCLGSKLRPGGLLVVEVPDFSARLRTELGPQWPYFRPGEHLYHFGPASLGVLLERNGFEVVRKERHGGYGLLAAPQFASERADSGSPPPSWRGWLYASRRHIYRIPGARSTVRWLNRRIGYDWLGRHAHLRIWARRTG